MEVLRKNAVLFEDDNDNNERINKFLRRRIFYTIYRILRLMAPRLVPRYRGTTCLAVKPRPPRCMFLAAK